MSLLLIGTHHFPLLALSIISISLLLSTLLLVYLQAILTLEVYTTYSHVLSQAYRGGKDADSLTAVRVMTHIVNESLRDPDVCGLYCVLMYVDCIVY